MNVTMVISLLIVSLAVSAASPQGVLRKSGKCRLQEAGLFEKEKIVTVHFGNDQLEMVCRLRGGFLFGKFTLFAAPLLTNKSDKKLNVSYHVAFLDKAGELVASASQASDFDPRPDACELSSCNVRIPGKYLATITSYKIVVYISAAQKR